MNNKVKKEILAYGLRILLSPHPEIRRLKRENTPTSHGNKFWTSSWLLMDYFKSNGLSEGSRVMEIGCGWGLTGIYCAKKHNACVTGVDIDPHVFPFLNLHAAINKVNIKTMKKSFDELTGKSLSETDILVGADICFWDEMVAPLQRLIERALRSGVKTVLIADPVRSPFEKLGDYFKDNMGGEIVEWSVKSPRHIQGKILKVSLPG
jgi:predicted nicotinamide N-methyase